MAEAAAGDREKVVNGIAWDKSRLFVTGKNWSRAYEIAGDFLS